MEKDNNLYYQNHFIQKIGEFQLYSIFCHLLLPLFLLFVLVRNVFLFCCRSEYMMRHLFMPSAGHGWGIVFQKKLRCASWKLLWVHCTYYTCTFSDCLFISVLGIYSQILKRSQVLSLSYVTLLFFILFYSPPPPTPLGPFALVEWSFKFG